MLVALLIAVDDDTAAALARRLPDVRLEAVASASEALAQLRSRAEELGAVVLGPSISAPLQLARRVQAADPDESVLVLHRGGDSGDALRRAFQLAPLLGESVRCLAAEPEEALAAELRDALQQTRTRRAHRRTIRALNERIGQHPPEPPRSRADEYLDQLLEHAPIGIVLEDDEGRVVAWNAHAEVLTGLTERRMLGAPIASLLLDEEATRWGAFRRDLPPSSAPRRGTFQIRGRSGPMFVETTLAAIGRRDGQPGTLVLLEDVTAREQARRDREAALADLAFLAGASAVLGESLDLATTLQNTARAAVPRLGEWCVVELPEGDPAAARVAVAHVDPTGSDLARRLRARAPRPVPAASGAEATVVADVTDEVLGRLARDEEDLALLRELRMRSFASVAMLAHGRPIGRLWCISTETQRRHGTAEVALALALADRAAVAVENARLYAAAGEARSQAEQASRLKDEFLGVVSHELRTPLTSVLGWAQILSRGPRTTDQLTQGLATITRNAAVLERLIDDLLETSRLTAGKVALALGRVDLASVARLAVDVVASTASAKGVTLELTAPAPVIVLGDADRLQQVLWNLFGNAVKFTPPGGRVEGRVHAYPQGAEVVVRDTGVGISPEFLPVIFDRFRQADASATRAYRGLGLGLAIVRELVELHGGTVRAESAGTGTGATFTVTLPAPQPAMT